MELVEGPTLADRIAQGPLALDEALPVAKQIAEALEADAALGVRVPVAPEDFLQRVRGRREAA